MVFPNRTVHAFGVGMINLKPIDVCLVLNVRLRSDEYRETIVIIPIPCGEAASACIRTSTGYIGVRFR